MVKPILIMPYWVADKVSVSSLTKGCLHKIEDILNDEELLWVMHLHKLPPFNDIITPLHRVHNSIRTRSLSPYELPTDAVIKSCYRFLRTNTHDDSTTALNLKLYKTIDMHVMLIAPADKQTNVIRELAKQYSDLNTFGELITAANGKLFNKYIN